MIKWKKGKLDDKVEERKRIKDVIQKSLSLGAWKTGGPTKRHKNVEEKPALREIQVQCCAYSLIYHTRGPETVMP